MIVSIGELGPLGDGVAEVDGQRVFVPFVLPGERVEVAREGTRARPVRVLSHSADRAEPVCPIFGTCGGCSLQHLNARAHAAFKRERVAASLRQARVHAPVAATIDARGEGRRRVTLHMDGVQAGYMRARSHELIDVNACPVLVPALRERAPAFARALGRTVGAGDVLITATDSGLDVDVRLKRSGNRADAGPDRLVALMRQLDVARMTFNGEDVLMARPPSLRVGRAVVALPAGGFLQATEAAEIALFDLVRDGVGAAKSVADLFCGVGPFALRLAERAKVAAWDADRAAVGALTAAARHTSGLKPVTAQARDLFRNPLYAPELAAFDAVVFDPPRAGARAQARELARSRVPVLVAVSCEPKSFARDAAILIEGGYRLEQVTPVDQFAYSAHVEIVGVFRR